MRDVYLSPEDGRVVEHRPASAHPEDICQRCGGPNVVWFAPNDVWNRVMPDDGGILCPTCFVQLATSAGLDSIWCVAPSGHPVRSLEQRLATVAAERDRLADEVRRFGRELAAYRTALATTYPALRRVTLGKVDRMTEEEVRDLLDWCDRQGIVPPTPGDTP